MKCSDCQWKPYCLPEELEGNALNQFEQLVQSSKPFRKHEHLYHQGAPFHSFFAIQSGSVKTQYTLPSGYTQITAFYFSGEMIGLDGIETGKHPGSAIVLEDTQICEISFARLEAFAREIPAVSLALYKLLGRELVRDQALVRLLGSRTVGERVATFLHGIARRQAILNPAGKPLMLSMARGDIASFLGVSIETVSRELSRLHKEGIIERHGRHIIIHQTALSTEYVFQLLDRS